MGDKKKNMLDYLTEYGDKTFKEQNFCPVDSLILASLSYLKFDGFRLPATLFQMNCIAGEKKQRLFAGSWNETGNKELFEKAAGSVRFRNTRVAYYVDNVDDKKETQFSAMVFLPEDGLPYIAFRGTDETSVGWKEDFNMAFLTAVPAQLYALSYAKQIISKLPPSQNFYLGGHSKGGNIAVFSAANLNKTLQERIEKVYSFDGPGFKRGFFQEEKFKRIEGRTIKIVPNSSIVGILLENQESFQIVASSQEGILQHDPFSWIVEEGDFLYREEMNPKTAIMNEALNLWISELEDEERKKMIDALFLVLDTAGISIADLLEEKEDRKEVFRKLVDSRKELGDRERKYILEMLLQLFHLSKTLLVTVSGHVLEEEKGKLEKKPLFCGKGNSN